MLLNDKYTPYHLLRNEVKQMVIGYVNKKVKYSFAGDSKYLAQSVDNAIIDYPEIAKIRVLAHEVYPDVQPYFKVPCPI